MTLERSCCCSSARRVLGNTLLEVAIAAYQRAHHFEDDDPGALRPRSRTKPSTSCSLTSKPISCCAAITRISRGRSTVDLEAAHKLLKACAAGHLDPKDWSLRRSQEMPRSRVVAAASVMPSGVILEGLCKSKRQDSVQLQFDQETVRNNGQTSYSRLKRLKNFILIK